MKMLGFVCGPFQKEGWHTLSLNPSSFSLVTFLSYTSSHIAHLTHYTPSHIAHPHITHLHTIHAPHTTHVIVYRTVLYRLLSLLSLLSSSPLPPSPLLPISTLLSQSSLSLFFPLSSSPLLLPSIFYSLGHQEKPNLLAFHPQASSLLASAGYDGRLLIWNLDTRKIEITMDTLPEPVSPETSHK